MVHLERQVNTEIPLQATAQGFVLLCLIVCLKLKIVSIMVIAYLPQHERDAKEDHSYLEPAISPFAGRLGDNQDFYR